ncbi:hypothetical protein HME9304_00756 [Flagellimonas maritima]|uniref:Uncharacterized protein n=1 Tax=Flagellimonas maritima TaxID=1383885 RepID=A0A2Z4LPG5_9FLAO|nr:hypothetical protein HME9304_00756 [Allomuricauda aurantiaca]
MKEVLLIITVLFSSFAVTSCTNDEDDQDLEILTPEEETQLKKK